MPLTAEETSKFVQAGDVKIHYHEAGSGPPVICIHGGAPGAYGWGNFGRNMDTLAEKFRTIIVDLPGYGKSDKPEVSGGRYAFYARTFKAMFEQLGIQKAHVIGLATGGGAAMMMAIEYPEIVDRLVLVSSAGSMSNTQLNPTEGQKMIQGYYGGNGPSLDKMRRYIEMMMYDKSLITDDVVQERYEASIQPEFMVQAPEGRGAANQQVTEPVWKDLDRIQAQTLVVWGRDNRVQNYDNALFMLMRIPDVQLHIYGRTGLWVPFERAKEFSKLVTSFLLDD
jgi:2-hydroxy-6-oxonona-2,4-dienedioate hydrolase/4,5:9,10-diseco-3-hydroxy-5,9,17-trioxoandrosta-1(10),2-diene-4-oate hydrolase